MNGEISKHRVEVGVLVYDRQFRLLEHSKRKSQLISELHMGSRGLGAKRRALFVSHDQISHANRSN